MNKQQKKEYSKAYYLSHPDLKEKNRIKSKERWAKMSEEDRIKRREYLRLHRAKNAVKYKSYAERWNKSRKGKEYQKEWRASEEGKQSQRKCQINNKRKNYKERDRKINFIANIKLKYGCMNPNCPSSKTLPSCCLDMHHIDSETKVFSLAAAANRSFKQIFCELRKCTVLCANCHRLVSANKLDASNFKTCEFDPK